MYRFFLPPLQIPHWLYIGRLHCIFLFALSFFNDFVQTTILIHFQLQATSYTSIICLHTDAVLVLLVLRSCNNKLLSSCFCFAAPTVLPFGELACAKRTKCHGKRRRRKQGCGRAHNCTRTMKTTMLNGEKKMDVCHLPSTTKYGWIIELELIFCAVKICSDVNPCP